MEVHGVLVQSEKLREVGQFDWFRWEEVIYWSGYCDRRFARILVTNWYGWIAPALEDMQPSVSDARRYF
jgi:hypothetical protein